MARYLLVPGACHGAWNLEPLAGGLEESGHRAEAVTLAGLEHVPGSVGTINLDTHIDQLTAHLQEMDGPAVLVGHSYAGSVITGVADRLPERVAGLLYVDAFVPSDGESCWSMTNDEQRQWYTEGSGRTGIAVDPMPFFDERAVPHPLGTLMQRSRLTGANEQVERRIYLAAVGSPWIEHSPFVGTADRLRTDPAWSVVDIDCSHNVMATAPDDLLRLALSMAR
jgi:pimeloyl-ACP methyl ester carboxylesterase